MKIFEEHLVKRCAPTLAGLKSGNLFRCRHIDCSESCIKQWNKHLNCKGIFITTLRSDGDHKLIYVYRKDMVISDINKKDAKEFLERLGYDCSDVDLAMTNLKERMDFDEFPHEIGLFLGYPFHDVVGFIDNNGRECRYCGCWKVYEDEHQTKEQFVKFKECSTRLMKRFNSGVGLVGLVV